MDLILLSIICLENVIHNNWLRLPAVIKTGNEFRDYGGIIILLKDYQIKAYKSLNRHK